jgi:CRISPR system Cascade subunit CasB
MAETTEAPGQTPGVADLRLERAAAFLNYIRGRDKGELAALRRAAGESLAEARGVARMYGYLQRFGVKEWDEQPYFLAATLFAYDKAALDGRAGPSGDLGRSLAALASSGSAEAAERRLLVLLDSDWAGGELEFRLRQVVKRLIQQRIPVDWPRLIVDLCDWNRPDRRVQKRWASSFYDPQNTQPTQ